MPRGGSILLRRKRPPPRTNQESSEVQLRRDEAKLEMLRKRRQKAESGLLGRLHGDAKTKAANKKAMFDFLEVQRSEKDGMQAVEAKREQAVLASMLVQEKKTSDVKSREDERRKANLRAAHEENRWVVYGRGDV